MYDLISIGHINIDLYFKGKNLTFENARFQLAVGGKYYTDSLYERIGGGGANVAIGVSKNGLKTALLGKVDDNYFKKLFEEKLKEEGVSLELLQFEDNYLNISCILLTETGERTIIHFEPSHGSLLKDSEYQKLLNSKAVYMGNLPDVSLDEKEGALNFLKDNSIITIVNLGTNDCRLESGLLEKILKNTDVLILNAHEFADLIKTPYEKINLKVNSFINDPLFKEKAVVITDGEKGSYGYINGTTHFQEAVKVEKILDSTGCGDAYTAGFIAEYLISNDLAKSMQKGASYASQILAQIGAN